MISSPSSTKKSWHTLSLSSVDEHVLLLRRGMQQFLHGRIVESIPEHEAERVGLRAGLRCWVVAGSDALRLAKDVIIGLM